jgi:hypothetical protein
MSDSQYTPEAETPMEGLNPSGLNRPDFPRSEVAEEDRIYGQARGGGKYETLRRSIEQQGMNSPSILATRAEARRIATEVVAEALEGHLLALHTDRDTQPEPGDERGDAVVSAEQGGMGWLPVPSTSPAGGGLVYNDGSPVQFPADGDRVARLARRVDELGRSRAMWEESAQQESRNAAYHRDLLFQCAHHATPQDRLWLRTSDDGSVQREVLVSKIPELVRLLYAGQELHDQEVARLTAVNCELRRALRELELQGDELTESGSEITHSRRVPPGYTFGMLRSDLMRTDPAGAPKTEEKTRGQDWRLNAVLGAAGGLCGLLLALLFLWVAR